ncbi:MAG: hypothetical protein AB7F88_11100 [Pyrinomonadaceae bacterium]
MVFLKATGIVGSILALIAVIILFLKSLIAFIGFITGAIKIAIVLIFVLLIVSVGFMVFRGLANSRRKSE